MADSKHEKMNSTQSRIQQRFPYEIFCELNNLIKDSTFENTCELHTYKIEVTKN